MRGVGEQRTQRDDGLHIETCCQIDDLGTERAPLQIRLDAAERGRHVGAGGRQYENVLVGQSMRRVMPSICFTAVGRLT